MHSPEFPGRAASASSVRLALADRAIALQSLALRQAFQVAAWIVAMSSNKALRTIFRALVRYNRQLYQSGETLVVRTPLDKTAHQRQQPTWTVNDTGMHGHALAQQQSHSNQT